MKKLKTITTLFFIMLIFLTSISAAASVKPVVTYLVSPSFEYDSVNIFHSINERTLLRFEKDKTFGICDAKTGKIIVPSGEYTNLSMISEKLINVEKNGKSGMLDYNGNVILPCEYTNLGMITEKLIRVEKDGKKGLLDYNGNVILPCEYDGIYNDFRYSYRGIVYFTIGDSSNRKIGLIDKDGIVLLPAEYDAVIYFNNGIIGIEKNGKSGYIHKNGKKITELIYDVFEREYGLYVKDYEFIHGIKQVKLNGKYGFIDEKGKTVVPCKYDDVINIYNYELVTLKKDDKWVLADINGNLLTTFEFEYDSPYFYSNGLAAVIKDGKYGYIDTTGKTVIPCEYDYVNNYFHEGLVEVIKDGKYGLINEDGKIIVPFVYEYIYTNNTQNYIFWNVKKNWTSGSGVVDKTGKLIVPCEYWFVDSIWGNIGYITVVKDNVDFKRGLYNTNGEIVLPCEYDYIWDSENRSFFKLTQNNKHGFFDIKTGYYTSCEYDEIDSFGNDLIIVTKNDKKGLFKPNGEVVIPVEYSDINTFFDNLIVVLNYKKRMLVDYNGKILNNNLCDFENFYSIFNSKELAMFYNKQKYGLIDNKGSIILPAIYNYIEYYTKDFSKIYLSDKVGYIDKTGEIIVPIEYDDAIAIDSENNGLDNYFWVKKNGKWGILCVSYKRLNHNNSSDINGDGNVNGMDLLLLKKKILEMEINIDYIHAMDINNDGKINGMDLLLLKKKILS